MEQRPQSYMQQIHTHEQGSTTWLTADDVEQQWKLQRTRNGAVLIPGAYNWKHQSIALGTVWGLPDGVMPAWSNQFEGLGGDYVGPVLTASDPALLEDIMKHPPQRLSVHQLMGRSSH